MYYIISENRRFEYLVQVYKNKYQILFWIDKSKRVTSRWVPGLNEPLFVIPDSKEKIFSFKEIRRIYPGAIFKRISKKEAFIEIL